MCVQGPLPPPLLSPSTSITPGYAIASRLNVSTITKKSWVIRQLQDHAKPIVVCPRLDPFYQISLPSHWYARILGYPL
jgi:hypothetical protein